MKTIIRELIIILVLLLMAGIGFLPRAALAEEGGSGHYMPGGTASFVDTMPGQPGFAYLNAFTFYGGSGGTSRTLKFGGLAAFNLDATVYADTSLFLYEAPWNILGGYCAAAIAIPLVWVKVSGEVKVDPVHGSSSLSLSDSANGVGDIEMLPVVVGWKHGDLKCDVRLGVYAPSGAYELGKLANLGKNYWTFEPAASVNYLSSKIGLELTGFAGFDINTTNHATDYHSGDAFHLEVTAAQHLPLLGGFIGVGANAYYYKQFTGDSGSGAALGSLEGHTAGIGPVVSYIIERSGKDWLAEAKWLPELDTRYRLEGDYVWFKVGALF